LSVPEEPAEVRRSCSTQRIAFHSWEKGQKRLLAVKAEVSQPA